MLGLLAHNQGKPKWPSATFGERLRSATEIPSFHHNLGNILKEAGRQDEAAECYQRALDLKPDLVGTLYNLGTLYQDSGRPK
ncbi:MAG: tetratricopeptide repeat protein [Alphaproteobacteria bacterium]|nr:tetratricopeptide repeat protein [Alphaproteobacteria bacterium]MBV9376198.1 tetratricopeptide repeat protein [Alphaproteobacteria bacterium]